MTDERRILELALLGLQAERSRIEREISDINKRLKQPSRASRANITGQDGEGAAASAGRPRRKRMSAAQKRKISESMRALWAARRRKAK